MAALLVTVMTPGKTLAEDVQKGDDEAVGAKNGNGITIASEANQRPGH